MKGKHPKYASYLPRHPTIYGKVQGIEETNKSVDDERNVARKIIVQQGIKAAIFR